MNTKELASLLLKSVESNSGKFVPWWEDDFENCMYRYDMFSEEDIQNVTECVKNSDMAELLAPVGGMGMTVLHLLVWNNFEEAVRFMIDNGADVNVKAVLGQGILKDVCIGVTPFLIACYQGNLSMAKLLIEAGAELCAVDEKGRNAYHYLCSYINKMSRDYECV